jgi:hypothetical protein
MVSSDMTYRLIQQTRLVEDIRQPAYENRHARANRLFARALFAVIARDLIRSGRRRREIASLSRLRFSPFEIYTQCEPQPFLTPVLGGRSCRPPAFVPTIHHHQPAHRAAHCVGAIPPNQGTGEAVSPPGIAGLPNYRL